ncbi:RNA polymerase sigma factor [candidate division KSB1 bacterium]|nr:RNA polymerase sigma factor [candidate division KSB1 bacterium]RQW06859.1 MAG: RNA polymerase sigma factor [candidate division KSB1 bacterium]
MSKGNAECKSNDINGADFKALFHQNEAALFRYIRYLAGSSRHAEDIYQETWLRVVGYLRKGKRIQNFKGFLFTVATNIYRDELQRLRIRRFFLGTSLDEKDVADELWVSTETSPDQEELNEILEYSLSHLSGKQRSMFCLRFIEGFKISEISQIMKCAEGTVKATLYKAVQKLRHHLKNSEL